MSARSIDDQLAAIDALRRQPLTADSIAPLSKALQSKSNFLAARAAAVAGELRATSLADALAAAFHRFIEGSDKGCIAKTAIVKALVAMEAGDEELLLKGSRHVQLEPSFGGSGDAAVELRCESVMELVRRNSRRMWEPLVHLLADASANARATAVRALAATGQDHARYLLQYKLLIGDQEPAVMGECFAAILALTRSTDAIAPFLDSHDPDLREAAILALGESRLPEAFPLLRDLDRAATTADESKLILLSIAMTRQPEAIEYLLSLLRQPRKRRQDVLEALVMYRNDPAVRAKIEQAMESQK